jgi:hypothetical protein
MTGRLPRIQVLPEEHLSDSEPTSADESRSSTTGHHHGRHRRWQSESDSVPLGSHHESTDDAFIDGHIVHVAPQVGGRVVVLVTDNQPVRSATSS